MIRGRLRTILLLVFSLIFLLILQIRNSSHWTANVLQVPRSQLSLIVSLASSHHRLDNELPVTLRSLVAQTLSPADIRVYLPEADRSIVQSRLQIPTDNAANVTTLPDVFRHPLVSLVFTEDVGPATKFVPVLKELLERAHAGQVEALDQPVIIVGPPAST
jgi:hypothetical protein